MASSNNMTSKLDEVMASSSSQQDKSSAVLSLLRSMSSTSGLASLAKYICTANAVPVVVGRSVLVPVVEVFAGGSGYTLATQEKSGEWLELGKKLFASTDEDESRSKRMQAIREALEAGNVTWCEEQLSTLKRLLSFLLEQEEEWTEAARVLMSIPLESTGRIIPDEEKLRVYIQIVRLLLESGESGQAQTYFTRASLIIHGTESKEIQLSYRLCQARLFDFSRRFNEAAGRYHELSFVQDIDEEERVYMLSAAVTCAILAPAGPQRSRILSNLYRDERTQTSLPPYKSAILRRMFLDHILRMDEVREFESELAEHQKAKLALDRRSMPMDDDDEVGDSGMPPEGRKGAESILDRAVMEHNVLACARVYDNIHFDGLGSLLDLRPAAAEAMARTMIEQGRLRAWIDQVDRLIYFEGRSANDDKDVQGTAGGLGIAKVERPIEPVSLTERWDERIKHTATQVEEIANAIESRGLMAHS